MKSWGFEKLLRGFEKLLRGFEKLLRGCEKLLRGFEKLLRGFEDVEEFRSRFRVSEISRGFEKPPTVVWEAVMGV